MLSLICATTCLAHFASRQGGIDADAEAAESVRIGRRNLNQGHVDRHRPAFEQSFNLAQIDRSVVGAAVVDRFPHVGADEHGVVPEVPRHLRRHVGRAAHGHHVDDFHIAQRRDRGA